MTPARRAEQARAVLDSDIITEARLHMRDRLTQAAWRRHELAPADQAKLDALMRHYTDFFGFLERAVSDGRVAEAELKAKSALRRASEKWMGKV